MLGGVGDAGDGAHDGVIGDDGVLELRNNDLGAAGLAPALGSGGPALGDAHGAHAGSLGSDSGLGVDNAVSHPALQQSQVGQDVGLLVNGDELGAAVVGDADTDVAQGAGIILVAGDAGQAVLVQQQSGVVDVGSDVAQAGIDLSQGVSLGVLGEVSLDVSLGPDEEVGHGRILVAGDAVQLAADQAGVQVILGDQVGQAGNLSHQVGDVSESAHVHVGSVGGHVGEHQIVGLVGLDGDGAQVAPVAPGADADIQMHADLLLQVGIHLSLPGVVVSGLAAADLVPDQGGDLTGDGLSLNGLSLDGLGLDGCSGLGGVIAAGSEHANDHHDSQEHCDDLLHCVSS